MRKNKTSYYLKFIFLITAMALLFMGFLEGDKRGKSSNDKTYSLNKTQTSGKQGDAYRFNINNINMPMNRIGTMAAVNIPPDGSEAGFGNGTFLFSGGFFLSGLANGNLWAFAQATASLVENMTPGTVESGPNDPDAAVYVVNKEDEPFGQSWQDWKTAVDKFGADFYDGDGDGQYNPTDRNGNGVWDPKSTPDATDGEDMPDLLGDETAWCVYTDGIPGAQRTRFAGVNPQGVEFRQSVFAFASKGALGNMMFIRYRIKNTGLVADKLDSVYFGAWADPDLGETFDDDLVGIDVERNAGFTYNGGEDPDPAYGTQIPCFMIDFFSGPIAFIPGETFVDTDGDGEYTDGVDTPIDTGFSFRGQNLGIKEFPGAKNLDVSSFVHYQQSDPTRGDPNDEFEARHYMLGLLKLGDPIDPCNDPLGDINGGVDCTTIDPRFWYSGDPVTNVGWINNRPTDQRQMTNVGPFVLEKDKELEIVVAYVVGQGSDRLNSITVARGIDVGAQFIFDNNFKAPSPPATLQVDVESGPDFIDFLLPVSGQVSFLDKTDAWDNRFEGINVTAYKTNSTQDIVGGTQNSKLFTTYQLDSFIQNVFKENPETGGREPLFTESGNKLDPQIYSDPETGRIRVRITRDPFTNGDLVKGKPYYFSFTSYALNYDALLPMDPDASFGDDGDYFLSSAGFVQEVENVPKIITAVLAEDLYNPPLLVQPANQISGNSLGNVGYDIINKSEITTSQYEVTFIRDSSSAIYQMFWDLTNLSTNTKLVDSSLTYTTPENEDAVNKKIIEGFIPRVEEQNPTIGTPVYEPEANIWFTDLYDASDPAAVNDGTGVTYVGKDILQGRAALTIPGRSDITSAVDLRRVELRFGTTGKAYRYINGYLSVFARNTYRYAPGITPADTVNKGVIGDWDDINDRPNGFVDVPFTAWIVDDNFNVEQQLAVGFVERARNNSFPNGNPDGVWDPTDNLVASGEYIVIFNSPYDPNGGDNPYDPNSGGQIEFTGGAFSTPGGEEFVWADLSKAAGSAKDAPVDATNITEEQRAIFNSPWFNTLYVVGLQRADSSSFYTDGDKFIIPVDKYPYTEEDVYQFQTTQGGGLTDNQERDLFNKVNVYPNPLYGFNVATSYTNSPSDEPFVTFSNLPEEITVRIYSLSGQLLRTLTQADKSVTSSPFLNWDLQNESGLRVASGLYLAIVSSPKFGEKVLKFSIIMPEKQIQKF